MLVGEGPAHPAEAEEDHVRARGPGGTAATDLGQLEGGVNGSGRVGVVERRDRGPGRAPRLECIHGGGELAHGDVAPAQDGQQHGQHILAHLPPFRQVGGREVNGKLHARELAQRVRKLVDQVAVLRREIEHVLF